MIDVAYSILYKNSKTLFLQLSHAQQIFMKLWDVVYISNKKGSAININRTLPLPTTVIRELFPHLKKY